MASLLEDGSERNSREKRERRNLSRRKSYAKQRDQQHGQSVSQIEEDLLVDAQIKCQQLLSAAQIEANRVCGEATQNAANILGEAAKQAASILATGEAQCVEMMVRRDTLRLSVGRAEARLQSMSRQIGSENLDTLDSTSSERCQPESLGSRLPEDVDAAEDFRRQDAARKRSRYRNSEKSTSSSVGNKRKKPCQCRIDAADAAGNDEALLPNRKNRSLQSQVAWAASELMNRLHRLNIAARKKFFSKLWVYPSLKQYQPAVFGTLRRDKAVLSAVADVKQCLQRVKPAKRKDHLSAKQVLTVALAGETIVANRYQTSVARALGIKRQNIYRASKKRKAIDADLAIKFPMGERKVRSDKISADVRSIVEKFWEENTRISPCTKDKAKLRLAPKVAAEHRIHWLEDTEVDFFLKFQEWCSSEENGVAIGLRSFQYLKPYYIRTMKDRNVCCCKAHVEMDLLKEAINKFRKFEHSKECPCSCPLCRSDVSPDVGCIASRTQINSVRKWTEGALCPIPESTPWHKRSCLMGKCKNCGVKKVMWCSTELSPTEGRVIEWQAFEYVELDEKAQQRREKKKGTDESRKKKVMRQRMVLKRASMVEFKEFVLKTMKTFIVHNFRARWQSEQFKLCLKTFPRGIIVSSIDFSENYTFKVQNEIQTQHWDNKQVTLLIHVTYRHREDCEESLEAAVGHTVRLAQDEGGNRDIIADYHFYVSDDNCHDTLMVQHCMDRHNSWMKEQGIRFNQHWVWSDGAASQFKACRPFYYVSRYYRRFGARMKWFFHASGHGKGVADALGGHIKQGLEKEQLRGIHGYRLENAHDVVQFCKDKFAMGQSKEYGDVQLVRRMFWEIPKGAVNRMKKWDCNPIKGTRILHSFDGFSDRLSTLLQVRELSCFCCHCIDDEPLKCMNTEWTGPFELVMVRGILPTDVKPDLDQIGVGEGLSRWDEGPRAECVQVGDFFAVRAEVGNTFNVDFYILQCDRVLVTLKKSFKDEYEEEFNVGDQVLRGVWYQQVPGRVNKYVVVDKAAKSHAHARTVVHLRFGLTPCVASTGSTRWYTLESDTLAAIQASLDA